MNPHFFTAPITRKYVKTREPPVYRTVRTVV